MPSVRQFYLVEYSRQVIHLAGISILRQIYTLSSSGCFQNCDPHQGIAPVVEDDAVLPHLTVRRILAVSEVDVKRINLFVVPSVPILMRQLVVAN